MRTSNSPEDNRELQLSKASFEIEVLLTKLQAEFNFTPSEMVILIGDVLNLVVRKLRHR